MLHQAKFGKNDKKWFPRRIRRDASTVHAVHNDLPVPEADVMPFLRSLRDNGTPVRSLRDNGTPAWQQLQAVRTVEAYRVPDCGGGESLVQ